MIFLQKREFCIRSSLNINTHVLKEKKLHWFIFQIMLSTDERQECCALQRMSREQQNRNLLENMPSTRRITLILWTVMRRSGKPEKHDPDGK